MSSLENILEGTRFQEMLFYFDWVVCGSGQVYCRQTNTNKILAERNNFLEGESQIIGIISDLADSEASYTRMARETISILASRRDDTD